MTRYTEKTSVEYHKRQLIEPYESTKALKNFFCDYINTEKSKTVLDLACGSGVNSFYLSKYFKDLSFTGVDISEKAINIGMEYLNEHTTDNVSIRTGDLYDIFLGGHKYDISIFIQTLFAMEDAYQCLEGLMGITNKYMVLLSLFTEDNVEALTKVTKNEDDSVYYFNILSLDKVRSFSMQRGYNLVINKPFNIGIDIDKKGNTLGSYTKMLSNGMRDTFTGPVYLPWQFILLEKK